MSQLPDKLLQGKAASAVEVDAGGAAPTSALASPQSTPLSSPAAAAATSSIGDCSSCALRRKSKRATHSCSGCDLVVCDAHAPAHAEDYGDEGHEVRAAHTKTIAGGTPAGKGAGALTSADPTLFGTPTPTGARREKGLQCVLHDKDFEFYCNSCHVPVCVSCIVFTHSRGAEHELLEMHSGRDTTFANVATLLPAAATTGGVLIENARRHRQVRHLESFRRNTRLATLVIN